MQGILRDRHVSIENKRDASKLCNRGFGKPLRNGKLKLDLVEAAYLLEKGDLTVLQGSTELDFQSLFDVSVDIDSRFGHRYMVYRDLRKRGYRVDCLIKGFDFAVTPRKEHQSGFVHVVGEREEFSIEIIGELLNNIRKRQILWVAIVDEEADITYYSVFRIKPKGLIKSTGAKGEGILIRNHVFVFDRELASRLLKEEFFGKPFNKGLQLSLIEALYLKEKNVIDVYYNSRSLTFNELVERAMQYQPDIRRRYAIYRDLKKRGLSVKTGFKFGTHFRAYEKDPHHHHAEYLVDVVDRKYRASWSLVSRGIRLAHSVKKIYTIAVVDDLDYIAFRRLRP